MSNKYVFVTVMHDAASSALQYILAECKNAVTFTTSKKKTMEWGRYAARPQYTVTKDGRLMCEEKDKFLKQRWPWADMKQKIDRALSKEGKLKKSSGPVAFILKDPISVIIAQLIDKNFPADCYFVVMVRDPYSVIESTARKLQRSFPKMDVFSRIKRATQEWISCQQMQRENIINIPKLIWFRYEDLFGDAKGNIANGLVKLIPELSGVNFNIKLVGDAVTHPGEFRNCNAPQRKRLNKKKVDIINEELRKHIDLLSFFGYEIWEKDE